MSKVTELSVNGKAVRIEVDGERSLLSVLRDDLDLTGSAGETPIVGIEPGRRQRDLRGHGHPVALTADGAGRIESVG